MNRRQHARLARQLIEACDGLVQSAEVCRIGKSQLSDCQSPLGEAYMPADVIVALEAYCGQRIYSRALFEAQDGVVAAKALTDEACEATESVGELQRAVRLAAEDGRLTPAELERLARLHQQATQELGQVGDLLARAGG